MARRRSFPGLGEQGQHFATAPREDALAQRPAVTAAGGIIVAPHDPIPLLGQIEAEWPGGFALEYLDRGPEAWRIAFTRN